MQKHKKVFMCYFRKMAFYICQTGNIPIHATGVAFIGPIVSVLPLVIFYCVKKITKEKDTTILSLIPAHFMYMNNVILTVTVYIIIYTKDALEGWITTLVAFCVLEFISLLFYLPITETLQDRLATLKGLSSFMFCVILWINVILNIMGKSDIFCIDLHRIDIRMVVPLCYILKMCYCVLLIVGYLVMLTESYISYFVKNAQIQRYPVNPDKSVIIPGISPDIKKADKVEEKVKEHEKCEMDIMSDCACSVNKYWYFIFTIFGLNWVFCGCTHLLPNHVFNKPYTDKPKGATLAPEKEPLLHN